MKKTGLIRFLSLSICLLMALGAIGAGKPVTAVREQLTKRTVTLPEAENAETPAAANEADEPAAPIEDITEDGDTESAPEALEPEEPEALEPEAIEPVGEQTANVDVSTRSVSTDETDADFDGVPDVDNDPDDNTFNCQYHSGSSYNFAITYTMDYRDFFGDNTVYNTNIAGMSVWASQLCYDDSNVYIEAPYAFPGLTLTNENVTRFNRVSDFMTAHGMEDIIDYTLNSGYSKDGFTLPTYTDDDITEVFLGHHKVTFNGETREVIAVFVRGTKAVVEEWCSNFDVGDLYRYNDEYDSVPGKNPRQLNAEWTRKTNHRGFDVCATRIHKAVELYMAKYVDREATPVFWLSGHSRGAAIANILASYYVDENRIVYAYTYASPSTTANTEASAEKYDCIFNLVNGDDLVPMLPMPEWGFTRYGRTESIKASSVTSADRRSILGSTDYNYPSVDELSELVGKFVSMTVNNDGINEGWRDVYVYHCYGGNDIDHLEAHDHAGETVDKEEFREGSRREFWRDYNLLGTGYNTYDDHLKKYSYCVKDKDGSLWAPNTHSCCQTPAYAMMTLATTMGGLDGIWNTISSAWTFSTGEKLATRFDYGKTSLLTKALKVTNPHYMENYYLIQTVMIRDHADVDAEFKTSNNYKANAASASYVDANGRPAHTHTYTYVAYENSKPTCTEDGLGYRYCLCSETDAGYYDDYQKNVVIPATGHDWDEPTYVWAKDGDTWTCTATHVCKNDASHIESETVTAVSAVKTEANCTEAGVHTYTATFENEAFAQQIKTEADIPALGHSWGEATYVWAEDCSTVTATHVCTRDDTHIETETKATECNVTEPTVSADGVCHYTVTFDNEAFETQAKDVVLPRITPTFKSQSLTLSGEIGINFFVLFPEGIDPNGSYMTFTVGTATGTETANYHADFKNGDGSAYGYTCHVNALQMADTVTATLNYTVGEQAFTCEKTYSVESYIDYFKPYIDGTKTGYSEELLTLLKSLADYGHYAQLFSKAQYGWEFLTEDTEVNAEKTYYTEMSGYSAYDADTYAAVVSGTEGTKFEKNISDADIDSTEGSIKVSLWVDSKTTMTVSMLMTNCTVPTVTVGTETLHPGDSYTDPNTDLTYRLEQDAEITNKYTVSIIGIRAQNLARTYTVNGDANGAFSITACPLYYVKLVMAKTGTDDLTVQWKDCVTAIYYYCQAVTAYRATLSN